MPAFNFRMKQFFLGLIFISTVGFSQEIATTTALDFSVFRGNVLKHTQDLGHLVTGHPDGFLISINKQTNGAKEWHKAFNYPDYGAYFMYQDYKNEFLGTNLAAGLHYNFYFLNRNLQFKIAQGITYNNKPYNKETNSKNKAFGSKLDANINLGLSYKKDNIIDNIGFQTGFLFTHSSNGRFKSPNSGINTFVYTLGLNYNFEKKRLFKISEKDTTNYREPIHYNLVFKTGLNESPVIGSGQFPLYHFAGYIDKRLNRKSSVQLGAELFLTLSQKEFIKYKSISNFEKFTDPNTDYKRVGIMVGHELHLNDISIETQIGYYVYQPFKDDIAVYDRLGLKYYINKNIFAVGSLKTHIFYAEAFEFGVGYRL